VRRLAAWPLTGGPHMSANFKYQKTQKFPPSQEKWVQGEEKSGKIDGGTKSNLEHFSLLQLLPNLHGF
jgi:hypothetical protein